MISKYENYIVLLFIFTATFFFGMQFGSEKVLDFFMGNSDWHCEKI